MAAPTGNQFWLKRSKHGRDKLFTSPDILWEAACEYFQWCEDNPLYEVDFRGKDLEKVEIPKMRAFTWDGLDLFLDIHDDTLRNYGKKAGYEEYFGVISQIDKVIKKQKFEGAAAGFLNANIISRDLGLSEKTEHSGEVKSGVTVSVVSANNTIPESEEDVEGQ